MSRIESITPAGLSIARAVKSLAAAQNSEHGALAYAEGQRYAWANTPATNEFLKAAVASNVTGDAAAMTAARVLFDEFVPLLRARTLLDRIPGFRSVPANVSVLRYSGDASAAVVGEGQAIPLSKFALERVTLGSKKVAGMIVVTREALSDPSTPAERSLADQLAKAVSLACDRAAFSVDTSGSIANSGTIIASAGSTLANIDSDLQRMLAYYASADAALDSAVFVLSPTTAAYLASLRGSGGALAFNGSIGARGGSLLGVPVYVSAALDYSGSPSNRQITLFDPGQVLLADQSAIELATSENGSLSMDSGPVMDAGSPAPSAVSVVSLFQTNSVAVRAQRWINWQLANTSACVTLNAVTY